MFWSRFNVRRSDGGDGCIDGQRKHASKTIDPTAEIVILRLKNCSLQTLWLHSQCAYMNAPSTLPNGIHETQVRKNDHSIAEWIICTDKYQKQRTIPLSSGPQWIFDLIAFVQCKQQYEIRLFMLWHLNIRTEAVVKKLNHLEGHIYYYYRLTMTI